MTTAPPGYYKWRCGDWGGCSRFRRDRLRLSLRLTASRARLPCSKERAAVSFRRDKDSRRLCATDASRVSDAAPLRVRRAGRGTARGSPFHHRLRIEPLEDRRLLSVTADSLDVFRQTASADWDSRVPGVLAIDLACLDYSVESIDGYGDRLTAAGLTTGGNAGEPEMPQTNNPRGTAERCRSGQRCSVHRRGWADCRAGPVRFGPGP